MNWSVISAVNDEQVLNSCLLQSPDLKSASEVILQSGFASAADAYNSGILKSSGDIVAFIHQDVYLPEGWLYRVERAIEAIEAQDPAWGVLGVWGATKNEGMAGYLHWTGMEGAAGQRFEGGIEVETLDEVVLLIRRSSSLCFDESLRGFHMYGADICLEAGRRGMKSYAISAFCIHNTNGYKMLPLDFWKAYLFIRKKWKPRLPVKTTCTQITNYCWPVLEWNFKNMVILALGRKKVPRRNLDPALLYKSLFSHALK